MDDTTLMCKTEIKHNAIRFLTHIQLKTVQRQYIYNVLSRQLHVFFCKYLHILNVMPATGFKKVVTAGKKRVISLDIKVNVDHHISIYDLLLSKVKLRLYMKLIIIIISFHQLHNNSFIDLRSRK